MKVGERAILLDCRWLGRGGAGRATELLLRGLHDLAPAGRWVLWGRPDTIRPFGWPHAVISPEHRSPLSLAGQAAIGSLPPHDLAFYPHQIRPLHPGTAVTLIHDTIPLRYGATPASRLLKRAYLLASARCSTRILTVSEYSRHCIERDLRVPRSKIGLVHYPVDAAFVSRVQILRRELPEEKLALFVGRFAAHKNLKRLIVAFDRTRFSRAGGRLLLVGGSPAEIESLRAFSSHRGVASVTISGPCPQGQLERLYATAHMLVLPSLEEGFGLPAWEALTCGLPVCLSDSAALAGFSGPRIYRFPPRSTKLMAEAIDRSAGGHVAASVEQEYAFEGRGPSSITEFAGAVASILRTVARRERS